jgi:hypothetical protein
MSDIDITSDIVSGDFDESAAIANAANTGTQMEAPEGTVPMHGTDAKRTGTVEQKATAEDKSVRELLSSAFKGTDDKPVAQVDAPSANQTVMTKDGEGKYRNSDGTFASTEQVTAFEAASKAAPVAQPDNNLLSSMTPIEQEQFKSLPAETQQFVARTMENLNNRAARYNEYDILEKVIAPRREAWESQGITADAAINQLFSLSDFAGRSPSDFVMWFSDQHKLDLDALLDAKDAALLEQGDVDPRITQLQQSVDQLQARIAGDQNTQAQAEHQQKLKVTNNFALEKDEKGNFLRPYLTDIASTFATHVAAVVTSNPTLDDIAVLQKAYENACWSDINVRAKMQSALAAVPSDAERLRKARAAGSSVSGAPAGDVSTVPNNSNRTLREELQEQFASARA